jgi:hypothetical protein
MRRISHWSVGHEPIRLINGPTVTSLAALGSVVVTATDPVIQPGGADRQSTASKP